MEFEIVTGSVESLETDCLIVGVAPEGNLSPSADLINKASAGYLKDVVGDHQGKAGEAPTASQSAGHQCRPCTACRYR